VTFLDTGFLFALVSKRDAHHKRVVEVFREFNNVGRSWRASTGRLRMKNGPPSITSRDTRTKRTALSIV